MKKNTVSGSALLKYFAVAGLAMGILSFQSCGGDGSPKIKDAELQTILESTKGVITEVEEVPPGSDYKIIDEKLIDDKEKSIAIVHRLDGAVDTLSMAKLRSDSSSHPGLSNVLLYSLAGSYLMRNLGSTSPRAGSYKDANAFNKSTALQSDLTKSATSRRVSVPGKASSGYGSGKSFRSHGG